MSLWVVLGHLSWLCCPPSFRWGLTLSRLTQNSTLEGEKLLFRACACGSSFLCHHIITTSSTGTSNQHFLKYVLGAPTDLELHKLLQLPGVSALWFWSVAWFHFPLQIKVALSLSFAWSHFQWCPTPAALRCKVRGGSGCSVCSRRGTVKITMRMEVGAGSGPE